MPLDAERRLSLMKDFPYKKKRFWRQKDFDECSEMSDYAGISESDGLSSEVSFVQK